MFCFGVGGKRTRTADFNLAKVTLYHLSYTPRAGTIYNVCSSVAQWLEHSAVNRGVVGSTPT